MKLTPEKWKKEMQKFCRSSTLRDFKLSWMLDYKKMLCTKHDSVLKIPISICFVWLLVGT